jgi:hypothetical protein
MFSSFPEPEFPEGLPDTVFSADLQHVRRREMHDMRVDNGGRREAWGGKLERDR